MPWVDNIGMQILFVCLYYTYGVRIRCSVRLYGYCEASVCGTGRIRGFHAFFVYSLKQESVQTAKISGYENTHRKND